MLIDDSGEVLRLDLADTCLDLRLAKRCVEHSAVLHLTECDLLQDPLRGVSDDPDCLAYIGRIKMPGLPTSLYRSHRKYVSILHLGRHAARSPLR